MPFLSLLTLFMSQCSSIVFGQMFRFEKTNEQFYSLIKPRKKKRFERKTGNRHTDIDSSFLIIFLIPLGLHKTWLQFLQSLFLKRAKHPLSEAT